MGGHQSQTAPGPCRVHSMLTLDGLSSRGRGHMEEVFASTWLVFVSLLPRWPRPVPANLEARDSAG